MHNTVCFWKPFRSERVNESQKLLKFAEKNFDSTFSSLWAKMSYKKLFLIRFQILGLLVNTLTANYEYSCSKKGLYSYKVKSHHLKNIKPFAWLDLNFHNLHEIFHVPKKNEPHISSISEAIESEICAYLNGSEYFFLKTLWQSTY